VAQRVEIQYIDDLDGTEAAETLRFAIDGVEYEIDVSDKNAQILRDAMSPFVDAARRVRGRTIARRRPGGGVHKAALQVVAERATPQDVAASNATIRAWAASHPELDLPPVAPRGRIPQSVVEAFHAAGV
jgi:hypothetical protein